MEVPEVCVVYLLREDACGVELLLGLKKTGLGLGRLVGPGGKLEPGERPVEAAARELFEETGVTVSLEALVPVGEIDYHFPFKPAWTQKSWAFVATTWVGEPVESDELAPEWVEVSKIPFDLMWDDARHWLSAALSRKYVRAWFEFGPDNRAVVRWSVRLS